MLDFGLAKFMQSSPASSHVTNSPTLSVAGTYPGVILGTAGYMSPEQAKGHEADHRSDLFGVGCILYELLTGRQAFEGETASEILAGVLKSEVDLSRLPPRINPPHRPAAALPGEEPEEAMARRCRRARRGRVADGARHGRRRGEGRGAATDVAARRADCGGVVRRCGDRGRGRVDVEAGGAPADRALRHCDSRRAQVHRTGPQTRRRLARRLASRVCGKQPAVLAWAVGSRVRGDCRKRSRRRDAQSGVLSGRGIDRLLDAVGPDHQADCPRRRRAGYGLPMWHGALWHAVDGGCTGALASSPAESCESRRKAAFRK